MDDISADCSKRHCFSPVYAGRWQRGHRRSAADGCCDGRTGERWSVVADVCSHVSAHWFSASAVKHVQPLCDWKLYGEALRTRALSHSLPVRRISRLPVCLDM